MRDFDPTASEFISTGYLTYSRPGFGVRYHDPISGFIAAAASTVAEGAAATVAADVVGGAVAADVVGGAVASDVIGGAAADALGGAAVDGVAGAAADGAAGAFGSGSSEFGNAVGGGAFDGSAGAAGGYGGASSPGFASGSGWGGSNPEFGSAMGGDLGGAGQGGFGGYGTGAGNGFSLDGFGGGSGMGADATGFGQGGYGGQFGIGSSSGSGFDMGANPDQFGFLKNMMGNAGSLMNGAGALAKGAGTLFAGNNNANAARQAAQTQANAGTQNIAFQQGMFDKSQANLAPYMQGGNAALSSLSSKFADGSLGGNFTGADYLANKDPGYQFQLDQGNQALQNSQAAQDGVMSGAAMKGLINYNQGMASTGYQNAYGRWLSSQNNTYNQLSGVANMGENAAAAGAGNAQNFSRGIGDTMLGRGNVLASGQVQSANNYSKAADGIGSQMYALSGMAPQNSSNGQNVNADTGFNGQNNPANQAGLDQLMRGF